MSDEGKCPARPNEAPSGMNKWRRLYRFRRDLFSALPTKLYRAWMAEVKTPFYNSFLINDPNISKEILGAPPRDYPKSDVVYAGLRPLLGDSVFSTNGDLWERQRRIIDPSFEGGRIREIYPAMQEAVALAIARLDELADGKPHDIEFETAHFAADVIFRTLFSIPIEHELARTVFDAFRDYQRAQPVWNVPAILRAPEWVPRRVPRAARRAADTIRGVLYQLVDERRVAIDEGRAPDDLATKIMTSVDPLTGDSFGREEMVDQVAIFFLAGHETSASAMAWSLYLMAFAPDEQDYVFEDLAKLPDGELSFSDMNKQRRVRNVFSEALRLYPPVPILARESTSARHWRGKDVAPRDLCLLSPWHSGRHERIWDAPHEFRPRRWEEKLPPECRDAYFPFSKGGRVCIGAGFAMVEGVLGLSEILRHFEFSLGDVPPVPVAHLTVRAEDGISLRIARRVTPTN